MRNHILNQHMYSTFWNHFPLGLEKSNFKRSKNTNYINKGNIEHNPLELLFSHHFNHKMMRMLLSLSTIWFGKFLMFSSTKCFWRKVGVSLNVSQLFRFAMIISNHSNSESLKAFFFFFLNLICILVVIKGLRSYHVKIKSDTSGQIFVLSMLFWIITWIKKNPKSVIRFQVVY